MNYKCVIITICILAPISAWCQNDLFEDISKFDAYASLLYKKKNYSKAKEVAEKAIKIGEESESDVSETKILLDKINAESAK